MTPQAIETPLKDIRSEAELLLHLFEESANKESQIEAQESDAPAELKNKVRERVTDPKKQELIDELTNNQLNALTNGSTTPGQNTIIDSSPELRNLRTIYRYEVMDWGSQAANKTGDIIAQFTKATLFTPYPEFLKSDVLKLVKDSTENLNRMTLKDMQVYEPSILGAKLNVETKEVEVLIAYNQTKPSGNSKADILNFSQRDLNIPPQVVVGLLKKTKVGPNDVLVVQVLSPFFGPSGERKRFEILLPESKQQN